MTMVLIGVVLCLVGLGGYAIYRLWSRTRVRAEPTEPGPTNAD